MAASDTLTLLWSLGQWERRTYSDCENAIDTKDNKGNSNNTSFSDFSSRKKSICS